jgi:RNA polymerase primary sigma factor
VPSEDDLFRQYLEEIQRHPLLSRDDEARLARLAMEGDEQASAELVKANLRLVVAIAKRYRGTGIPLLDLVQEGNLGLMQAVEGYDPDRGFAFTTYATWWIRQAIARSIATEGSTIAMGIVTRGELTEGRLQEVWDGFVASAGRQPTLAELAADLGMPEERVADLLQPPPDLFGG